MGKTEYVGIAAIAAIGYFLIKKLEPLGQAATTATNTVTSYVERVSEKVEHVTNNASIAANTFERYYTPSGIAERLGQDAAKNNGLVMTDDEKEQVKTVVDNAKTVNDVTLTGVGNTATKAGVNAALSYMLGLSEGAASPGKSSSYSEQLLKNGTGAPYAQPTPEATNKAVQEYNIITGEKKTGSSSSSSKPATVSSSPSKVSVSKGGYSVGSSSGTTKNAGKYAPVKVKAKK